MTTIYLVIVVFLLCLAVFDLFVGVSNDAVNFLQPAVGAKTTNFRTILIIASCGVIIGAMMSTGMMDVARHGIMTPSQFTFEEVMIIFLAVMTTDIIVLDLFNSLGMPTSTTVSLVFELLGGTFLVATLKMINDDSLNYAILLNTDHALKVIIAIFVSVAIAFVFGTIIMWISRVVFTFNYKKHMRYTIAIFGGIAFTSLSYFIFMKGLGNSPYISETTRNYINEHIRTLLMLTFLLSTIVMEIIHLLKGNVFKFVVLMGTFALAMAFAGNDLVNFIGVPLAGLDTFLDYMANANGTAPSAYMMTSLMESAKTPPVYLMIAGLIMIIAMSTSKKAQNVIKTSVDLSRQDEGDEMFGSSRAARGIVRFVQSVASSFDQNIPRKVHYVINTRFNKNELILEEEGAAFDMVRAAINLVIASMLITIGTNLKLPLSTTYVTFMVAMGTSLADRAWSRESAVFRVTGVLSVIGGWFLTAALSFMACALMALIMYYGGIIAQVILMCLVVVQLIRSNRNFAKKAKSRNKVSSFNLMMRTRDPELVWDMLRKHVTRTHTFINHFAQKEYNKVIDGFINEDARALRHSKHELKSEQDALKKYRRQEMLGLKKSPTEIAIERNTWFHLGANSGQQFVFCLKRMLEPMKEHVDNNFNPFPPQYIKEYEPIRQKINELMQASRKQLKEAHYDNYREILAEADACKDELSVLRKRHIDRIQKTDANEMLQVSFVYLNLLQESQEFLSIMRHQLRAAKKFMEN